MSSKTERRRESASKILFGNSEKNEGLVYFIDLLDIIQQPEIENGCKFITFYRFPFKDNHVDYEDLEGNKYRLATSINEYVCLSKDYDEKDTTKSFALTIGNRKPEEDNNVFFKREYIRSGTEVNFTLSLTDNDIYSLNVFSRLTILLSETPQANYTYTRIKKFLINPEELKFTKLYLFCIVREYKDSAPLFKLVNVNNIADATLYSVGYQHYPDFVFKDYNEHHIDIIEGKQMPL